MDNLGSREGEVSEGGRGEVCLSLSYMWVVAVHLYSYTSIDMYVYACGCMGMVCVLFI